MTPHSAQNLSHRGTGNAQAGFVANNLKLTLITSCFAPLAFKDGKHPSRPSVQRPQSCLCGWGGGVSRGNLFKELTASLLPPNGTQMI